jgi:hypothetical protein
MAKVFISYRRDDANSIVGRIYDHLVKSLGEDHVFKDMENIPLSADFLRTLKEAVEKCDILLAVIGRGWLDCTDEAKRRRLDLESDVVRIEIRTALQRGIPVIPLLVDGAGMPPEGALPQELKDLSSCQGMPIRYDPDFRVDMDRLFRGMQKAVDARRHKRRSWVPLAVTSLITLMIGLTAGGVLSQVFQREIEGLIGPLVRTHSDEIDGPPPAGWRLTHNELEGGYKYEHGNCSVVIINKENNRLDDKNLFISKIAEGPIPVTFNHEHLGVVSPQIEQRFHYLTIHHPNELSMVEPTFPKFSSDILCNSFFRLTYPLPDGKSAPEETSVVGSPSFRPPDKLLRFVPTVDKAMITTGGDDRVRVVLKAHFGTAAGVTSTRTYSKPANGSTTAKLSVEFSADEDIPLDTQRTNDAFRFLTASSIYSDRDNYFVNMIHYEDADRGAHFVRLDAEGYMPEKYIFKGDSAKAKARPLGRWFELVKEPKEPGTGSLERSILRVEVSNLNGLRESNRLGIQAFLDPTAKPGDDNLHVWVEWLDAPEEIAHGTRLQVDFTITASGGNYAPSGAG